MLDYYSRFNAVLTLQLADVEKTLEMRAVEVEKLAMEKSGFSHRLSSAESFGDTMTKELAKSESEVKSLTEVVETAKHDLLMEQTETTKLRQELRLASQQKVLYYIFLVNFPS